MDPANFSVFILILLGRSRVTLLVYLYSANILCSRERIIAKGLGNFRDSAVGNGDKYLLVA